LRLRRAPDKALGDQLPEFPMALLAIAAVVIIFGGLNLIEFGRLD
jgi:hypothetical protein